MKNLLKANEPELTEDPIEQQLRALLGRAQVVIAVSLVVPQLLIMFGVLELASGLEPVTALASLVAVQVALFTNHQLDTRAGVRLVLDALQDIDFEDDRIDAAVDVVDDAIEAIHLKKAGDTPGGLSV